MERKRAERMLFMYKVLRHSLSIIVAFLFVVLLCSTNLPGVPFFPYIAFWLFSLFVGVPLFWRIAYNRNTSYYGKNDRKMIKYVIIPYMFSTLIFLAIYWEPCFFLTKWLILQTLS